VHATASQRPNRHASFITLALVLPQPTQAHGGPELHVPGLLTAGNVEGLTKTGFRLLLVDNGRLEQ
jgi:hypothetical protein